MFSLLPRSAPAEAQTTQIPKSVTSKQPKLPQEEIILGNVSDVCFGVGQDEACGEFLSILVIMS